jgi:hypothetical protein
MKQEKKTRIARSLSILFLIMLSKTLVGYFLLAWRQSYEAVFVHGKSLISEESTPIFGM